MKTLRQLSLRGRMIVVSTATLIALTLVFSLIILNRISAALGDELHKRGQTLIAELARNSELPVRAGDRQSLERILAETAQHEDVEEVSIIIFATSEKLTAGRGSSPDSLLFKSPIEVSQGFADELEMLEAESSRVPGRPVGEARISMGMDSMNRLLRRIVPIIVFAGLVTIAGAIFVIFKFARALTLPLLRVADGARRIGAGQLDTRLEVAGGPEIEELARNMNLMAENLQQSLARMIQQEKMASLGHLAAGITHEVGNPLNSILLDAGLLQGNLPDGPERELATAIRDQARRMREIVRHLLDYARPSQLAVEPVRFEQALADALAILAHPLRQSGLRVVTDIPPDLPAVCGVRNMCAQVVTNIIQNAIEAAGPAGDLRIHAEVREPNDQGPVLRISFMDSGPGIAPHELEAVFDPFYSNKSGGTGLGLSVSKQIIRACGGRIWAEKGPGGRLMIELAIWPEV